MPLAEDQDMIQALAPKRSDQTFSVWILPRPKVGAVCPNWACTDLCGGRSVMSVPCTLRTA
jgi:hypothetical protein